MTPWIEVYLEVPEGYVAYVENLPGANTQDATLGEARANLLEAIALVLMARRDLEAFEGDKPLSQG